MKFLDHPKRSFKIPIIIVVMLMPNIIVVMS
jgi:hypothetical protein